MLPPKHSDGHPAGIVGSASPPIGREDGSPVDSDNPRSKSHDKIIIELTRVQPIEAEVIAARLRAAGIEATVGADSVYPSVTFADGVPVFVSQDDASSARALLEDQDQAD